ncbi:ESPR-type extended signal peptide-containing protein [Stenotrophomonas sp. TWI1149]|uniref:ESPR-type extended signal peptide-containing protein n=1 Tax=unclassified Stenotrophomonas TaxID=196198 RepID=UPI003208F702
MNFVYKLIFNISTGTWAVAHELAVSRGKKSRTRLAKAMAVALALPAGAAMAADSPAPLECSANEVKSHDGMLCETVKMLETRATSMATRGATDGGSATGNGSTAVGSGSQATGVRATAMGINAVATGKWTTSYGAFTNAVADGSIAIGNGAAVEADGKFGTAIGYIARAKAENSVALGSGAVADSSWTVSVGNDNTEQRRRIVHVAAGRGDSDAATVGQLTPLIAGLGGGAAIDAETGVVTGPTYKIDGKAQNLGEAIAGLGNNTQALKDKLTSSGLVAEDGKAIAAVTYDRDVKGETNFGSVTMGNGTGAVKLKNVAGGTADTDVVNVSQLSPLVAGLGGGAAIDPTTGAVTGPTYKVDGKEQKNLGDALTSLDAGTSALKETLASSGLVAADGKALAAVSYDRDIKGVTNYGSVTLGNGKGAVSLKNVAAGTDDTDAVNMTQLKNAMANATPAESTFLAGKGGGTAAKATGFNSVALGINSVADQANTVSVGSASGKRRITNLASAQEESDAATYGQVTALVGNASSSAQRALKDVNTRLSALSEQTGRVGLDSPFLKIDAPEGSEAAVVDLNNSAVAIGASTSAIGSIATAIGGASYAKGSQAAAIGGGAYAEGQGALAMGSARAEADNSTALGNGARATGAYTLAIGANARSAGMNGVALGNSTRANADNAVAIGTLANIDATATNSMAFGRNASVGAGATNAMSLGSNTTNTRANTVSVGSLKNERQITNVAAGTADTDAVNFSQLKSFVGSNGGGPLTVSYADETKASLALAGENGTTISNVKAGAVSATSTEAINGAQLQGTASSVASALGGGSTVKADGTLAAPSYTVGGNKHGSVGSALGAVDTSLTDLDGRTNNLASQIKGSGLVDDKGNALAAVTYDKKADGSADRASVTLGTPGTAVKLSNVAAGKVTAASTDAINGAQLQGTAASVATALGGGSTVKADGTIAVPSYTVGGNTHGSVGSALGAVDTSLTNLDGRTNDLASQIKDTGLVDDKGNALAAVTYDQKADGSVDRASVTLGTPGTAVKLSNVAAGKVTAASSDAINGAQLQGTAASVAAALGGGSTVKADGTLSAPSYSVGGKPHASIGGALGALDTSVTALDGRTNDLAEQLAGSGLVDDKGNAIAAVTYDQKKDGSADYASVTLGNADTAVKLSNVAAGKVTAASTDAINGAQLQGTATSVAAALGGGAAMKADGTLTAPSYTVGSGKYGDVGGAFGAVNSSLTDLDGRAKSMAEQLAGMGVVGEDGKSLAAVTYDQKKDGSADYASVTLGSKDAAVKLSNVAAGSVAAGSTEAINGAQLQGTASSVASALGGGSTVKADGTLVAPSYTVGGNKHGSVGSALGAVDTSLTDLDGRTNDLASQIKGSGLVDDKGNALAAVTYDKKADGSADRASVTLGTPGTAVKLSNVAAGKVTAASTDAINGAQLQGTAASVAAALGGGSTVKADGSIAAPSYTVGTTKHGDVGSAFGAVNTSLSDLDGRAKQLDEKLSGTGLVDDKGNALAAVVYGQNKDGSTNYGSVTLGKIAGSEPVRLKNLAAGVDSSDAVNVSQLTAATANPWFSGKGGGTAAKVSAFGSVAIGINSVADQNNTVSVGSSDQKRRITNVADGEGNYDAVNYRQLVSMVSGQNTRTQSALKDVDSRFAALDARGVVDDSFIKIDAPEGSEAAVVDLNNSAVAIGASSSAIGSIATAIGGASYAKGSQAAAIGGGAYAEGQGALAMGSARAEADNSTALGNGARATGAYTLSVGANARSAGLNAVALGNNTRANADNAVAIGNLANIDATATNSMAFGRNASVGAGATNAMSLGSSSTNLRANTVSVGSLNNERQITNVAAGTAETDAVNFSQLKKYVGENGGSGGAANPLAVAYTDADKGTVSLAGAEGTILSNVKAGSADTDAANVGQVKGVAAAIGGGASIAADGSVTAPSFTIGGGRYSNVGETFAAVDTSLTDLDGRVTGNSSSVTNLSKQFEALTAGTSGMVTFDAASNTVKVASAQAGTTVDFANSDNEARTLTNVAAGSAEGDAVNVAQLKGTAQSVAAAIGGGSVVNADGTVSQPSYTVGGTTVTNFGDAITNIDDRTTTNATELTTLGTTIKELSNGTSGLVTVDQVTGNVQVAAAQGGTLVDMEGTDGKRRVSGVANGTEEDDVVTIAQLRAAGAIDPVSGQTLSVLTYDGADLSRATLGGSQGTVLANVASGFIGAGSMEAINGGQLFDMNAAIQGRMDGLDGRVGTIEKGIAEGSIGNGNGNGNGNPAGDGAAEGGLVGPGAGEGALIVGGGSAGGSGAVSVGDGSKAEGDSSIAVGGGSSAGTGSISVGGGSSAGGTGAISVGEGSAASGTGSVAIGEGAKVTNDNSVAIGSGSTTTRDNEVSMGSAGSERVVSNVAAGIQGTDAVNLQQMDDRFKAEHDWSNSRFQSMDKRIDRMGAISAAYAGMAINTAGLSGDNRLGAGIGSQNGRSALAVGYQRILGEKKNVSVSLGGAFSGSDQSVSAGAGISW